jgi:uncharacterized protein YdhG (YjbR/CyaY superfamily)
MASSARSGGKDYSLVEPSDGPARRAADLRPPGVGPGQALCDAGPAAPHTGAMTSHADRERRTFTTVDEFIEAAAHDVEPRLVEMRRIIREALPDAEETISHNVPAYRQHGVVIVQLAGYTEDTSLGFFPTAGVFAHFRDELEGRPTSRSAIRFPLTEPLPTDLIRSVAEFRLAEAAAYAERKRSGA